MRCTQGMWNLGWPHHWHRRVSFAETITAAENDMWARPTYRDYVHCEKHEQCDACGATRRHRSCMCNAAKAETCEIYLAWRDHPR
jgi:hypothetical protein